MAGELRIQNISGLTVYGHVLNVTSRRWNGTQFETYVSGNYALYGISLTEQGSSAVYVGDFPVSITTAGHYEMTYYSQEGGSPAEGDSVIGTSSIDWDGSAATPVSVPIAGALSGSDWYDYMLRAFKRTDKETEVFDATKDTIDEMRQRIIFPEDEEDGDTTDAITVLGDNRIALEGDTGHFLSNIVLIDGDFGYTLRKISKAEYDRKYTGFGTGASSRGRPVDYCLFGSNIIVGPVPDQTDYLYKISFASSNLSTYDEDTVSIPFTNKYRKALRWGTLRLLFSDIVKNDDQAAKFGTLYESDLKVIERNIDRDRGPIIATRYQGF